MDEVNEALLRTAHSSLCIRWGTNAPFAIGHVSAEKIGFASDPCVVVTVDCRDEDVSSLVPVVRQRVFAELAERGWENQVIEFVPSVQRNRRRRFVDQNEESESYGRNKFGHEHRFSYRMVDPEFAKATFTRGSYAQLPER